MERMSRSADVLWQRLAWRGHVRAEHGLDDVPGLAAHGPHDSVPLPVPAVVVRGHRVQDGAHPVYPFPEGRQLCGRDGGALTEPVVRVVGQLVGALPPGEGHRAECSEERVHAGA